MTATVTSINSSATAQLLIAADGSRTSLTIQNLDPHELFLSSLNTVSTSLFSYRRTYGTGYTFDGVDARLAYYGIWDAAGSGAAVITAITDPATDSNGAITTYGQLKSEIASWLRPNATPSADMTARIPKYIGLAEIMIRRELHLRALDQGSTTLTITSGSATVPSGLQAVTSMSLTADPYGPILYMPIDQMRKLDPTNTDAPMYYDRVGSSFIFWPPTSATADISFRRSLTPLSADADTNWLLLASADVYLYGALVHADRRLIGPRLNEWKEGFAEALDSIERLERKLVSHSIVPMPNGACV